MKKHSKEHVIEVGEELFKSQGFHNTGTEDILKKSEYPRSSFYYHFKSKENFAVQVLEHYGDRSAKLYASVLKNNQLGNPMERLEKFGTMMHKMSSEKQFKSECLVQKFSVECAGLNDELRVASEIQLSKILAVIEDCMREGQNSNDIRKDIAPKQLAEFFHSLFYGGFILSRLRTNDKIMGANLTMMLDYIKN